MGKYNDKTKVREILKDDRAVKIVEESFPEITHNPLLVFFENMTLEKLAEKAARYNVSDEKIAKVKKSLSEL